MRYYYVCATQERGHVRASGRVTRKCMRVMRVRAWVCARVRVRMRVMRVRVDGCVLAGDL